MRLVILTAPSGSGKTTIAHRLMEAAPELRFSVSATTRAPREGETHGKDYFFLSRDEFRQLIGADAFVEYEEVYPGVFYGTLHEEIERIGRQGAALLDIDVKGALNVKRHYGDRALAVFIAPPSLATLAERLQGRGTETPQSLASRLERARLEIGYASEFDATVVNDDLDAAVAETVALVHPFLTDGRRPGRPAIG
jgi:guanylate kinase